MLKPSAQYNRRAAIVEDFRVGRLVTEIIRFFGYSRSINLWRCGKIYGFRTVQRRFQYASKEKFEKTHRENHRNRWKGWRFRGGFRIVQDNRCEKHRLLVNHQCIELLRRIFNTNCTQPLWACQEKSNCSPRLPFLASQQLRFKFLGLLRMKRNWKS